MQQAIEFSFGKTRYVAWRPREWIFFVSVASAGGDAIDLECKFGIRGVDTVVNPRWFTMKPGEGETFEFERLDGTCEEVTLWYEATAGTQGVLLLFDLPEGARLQTFEEMSAQAAAWESGYRCE